MSIDDVRLIEFSVDQIDGMKRVDALAEQNGGDRPKTQNPNLKVEDKANDIESCKSKVDSTNGYDANLKQKVGNADLDKIVFGRTGGGGNGNTV